MPFWRNYCEVEYVTCQRCERKVPVQECEWDGGYLVCTTYNCKDRNINGALEVGIAMEASRDRQELVPTPKLVNPVDVALQIQNVSASAGTY
jgi:hypothetical protein